MTMIHRAIPTAVALTAVLSISCASPPPSQEKLGKSLTAMKAAQSAPLATNLGNLFKKIQKDGR